jgi:hypothetical protein
MNMVFGRILQLLPLHLGRRSCYWPRKASCISLYAMDSIDAVFSFRSFNSLQILTVSVYFLIKFLQIHYPGLLKRQSPTTMLRWRYKSIPFVSTQSLLQCPSIFFFKGDSHVLITHLYAIALLRGLPVQGTDVLPMYSCFMDSARLIDFGIWTPTVAADK